MNGLIPLDNLSLQPITGEILALNEVSRQYGLTLSEEEARDLSDTRNTALRENERIEFGSEVMKRIVERFCASRYLDKSNYADVLNEITYYFYYIKAETGERIGDAELVEEMFKRFELFCRGDIDRFEEKEIDRIIRKINLGKKYESVYGEEDLFDPFTFGRETPENLLGDTYEENPDAPEEREEDGTYETDAGSDLDVFDDFSGEDALSGWANEDDLSLHDEVGEEAVEEDSAAHPLAGLWRDEKQYFHPGRLTGRGEELPSAQDLQLPGGATLSVGDAYDDDFEGFEEDEEAFLKAFMAAQSAGQSEEEELDALDAMLDELAGTLRTEDADD